MPEKPTETVYTPNQLYEIKISIKDLDYTNDVTEVTLTSSLATAYQVIELTFILDPNDVIIEDIFGGEPIKMMITLLREQTYPGPSVDIELMYLSSDFQLTAKDEMSRQTQKDRTYFTIKTVARNPFKSMATLVNDVFIGTNLNSVISSLASDVGTTVIYDTNGQNTAAIDQVCVPPMPFYKIIKEYNGADADIFDGYLDQRFGLFSGTPGVFCQYDNKVYIKNLTAKLQKDQTFTVYQLSAGVGDKRSKLTENIYDEAGTTGKVFYTYSPIETSYAGNARFATMGTNIKHVVKPKDTITTTIDQTIQDVAQTYSLLYSQKNKNLFIDTAAQRTRYFIEDTGNDKETTIFNSRMGRMLSDLSSVTLELERNLPVLNLINIGECVKFKPTTIEYQDFEGKYILWSSIVRFIKQGPNWQSTAQINLNRTNKKN